MEQGPKQRRSFLSELRRRRVIRSCFVFVVICWIVLQVLDIVAPALGYDADLASRYFLYAAAVGFPLTFALAWFFQVTPHGIERTRSFEERRILNNIAPINDRRSHGVSGLLKRGNDDAEVHWIISVETGPLSGLSYAVRDSLVIGRSLECDLAIVTPHVSRQHACLEVEGDNLYIEDLGSSNGTVINGKRTTQRQLLQHDDEVRLHDIIFRVTERLGRNHSSRQVTDKTTFIETAEIETAELEKQRN